MIAIETEEATVDRTTPAQVVYRARREELQRSINEIEQQIRALCKKQERALAAALAIEELLLDGRAAFGSMRETLNDLA